MHNVIELSRNMNEIRNVVIVKCEVLVRKQVLNVLQVTCNQIVHANHFEPFLQETIAQMTSKKSGCSGYKYAFHN